MSNYKSLQHTKWECKYHVVFIPKYRKKLIYGELRRHLGQVLRRLSGQKESLIEEGHLLPDHVHVMISIPVLCGAGDRVREKRYPHWELFRESAKLCWTALLGTRILRIDRGPR